MSTVMSHSRGGQAQGVNIIFGIRVGVHKLCGELDAEQALAVDL